METYHHNQIFGNWATVLLTTRKNGSIDYSILSDEIDVLIASRPNGIYAHGTAGEFYTLTEYEFDKISILLADKCEHAKVPFQIGINHTSPQSSLQRLRRIKSLRPCALQVILPDWFPPTLDEIITFFQKIEEQADGISLILYNPPHAKKILEPEEWQIIKKQVPSLQGLKVFDQNGDPDWYARLRQNNQGLSVFIPGHHMASGIKAGAHGSYSNMACLNPFAAQKWYNLIRQDITAALELESRIDEFRQRFIKPLITVHHYPNHAVDRFLALLGGWADVGANLRWPYKSIPVEYIKEIKPAAVKLIPEFFSSIK